MFTLALWETGIAGGPIILAAALVVAGTVATAAAFRPGALSVPTCLATVGGLGYATLATSAAVLVVVHSLSPLTFFVLSVTVSAALMTVALRARNRGAYVSGIAADLRNDGVARAAGLIAVAAAVVLHPGAALGLGPSSSWRYWADGVQIADLGQVPAASPHWGLTFPPTVSKALLNAFDAGASYLLGSDLTAAVGALTVLSLLACALALWAVGHELGLRQTAPVFALVGVAGIALPGGLTLNREFARDFQEFKAEDIGRAVAFCALALAIRAVRERSGKRDAAIIGFLGAASAATHLIPTVVALAVFAGVVVGTGVERRSFRFNLRTAAIAVGTFVAVLGFAVGLEGGDVGFQGAGGSYRPFRVGAHTRALDPTAAFVHRFEPFPGPTRRWETSPRTVLEGELHKATGLGTEASLAGVLLVGGGGLLTALWRRRRVPAVLGALALAGGVTLGALLFSYRYHTVVPGGFGAKRLFDYGGLPLTLLVCCILETGLEGLSAISVRALRWMPLALPIVIAFLVVSPKAAAPEPTAVAKARDALSSLRASTPCGARVLLNYRTTGSVELLAKRVAILEGMAPYLRPRLLTPTLDTIYGARAFFRHPEEHVGYLTDHRVNYIAVLSGPAVREAMGGGGVPVDLAPLFALAQVDVVARGDGIDILRVLTVPVVGRTQLPGYGC
jgi:hypothetical protein